MFHQYITCFTWGLRHWFVILLFRDKKPPKHLQPPVVATAQIKQQLEGIAYILLAKRFVLIYLLTCVEYSVIFWCWLILIDDVARNMQQHPTVTYTRTNTYMLRSYTRYYATLPHQHKSHNNDRWGGVYSLIFCFLAILMMKTTSLSLLLLFLGAICVSLAADTFIYNTTIGPGVIYSNTFTFSKSIHVALVPCFGSYNWNVTYGTNSNDVHAWNPGTYIYTRCIKNRV